MFSELTEYRDDPIEDFQVRVAASQNPDKLDLGLGIYRDKEGTISVFDCVREAERRLLERADHKGYRGPAGNSLYVERVEKLVLGDVSRYSSVRSIQTPGAGAGCHVGAAFIKRLSPGSTVWASTPCWLHQAMFFESAGLTVKYYPYYDLRASVDRFEEMLSTLQGMEAGDILLLHGSCHNPTGEDLTPELWQQLGELCAAKGAVPFVDIAYQGFGDGISEDVLGVQAITGRVPEAFVAVSSSKSFTIYCDRAGMLSLISNNARPDADGAWRMLRDVARDSYFMPPEHGAAIVAEILGDENLTASWESELNAVRERIQGLRHLLKDAILSVGLPADYIARQRGMFSCLPITEAEQAEIEGQHGIYMLPNARVNIAALNEDKVQRIASALRAQRSLVA